MASPASRSSAPAARAATPRRRSHRVLKFRARVIRVIDGDTLKVRRLKSRKLGAKFSRARAYRKSQGRARGANRGVWALCGGRFHKPLQLR